MLEDLYMAAPSPVEAGWLFGMREEGGHHEHDPRILMNVDQHQFEKSHVANSSPKLTSYGSPSTQKKKRTQPDPGAEVISLSPKTLTTTSRFICEVCNKGFQREQNLQLHRRGHSLPWKLKLKSHTNEVRKKVYVCPEPSCVHHCPSRALGDLTGIKKHFFRKHCEKKWECEKCSKRYAVQSDWKAHSKTCGTKEYRCDCGTLFSRRDSFMTHQAFCNAIAQGSLLNTTNLSALKSQVLGHMSMVNGSDFGSFMPSGPFHPTSTVASLSCSPTYHDQEDQHKLALDAMMQQKDQTPSENTDHESFFYSTAREDYSESTPNNVDFYNSNKIRNDFSFTNLYANHQLESVASRGSSAGLHDVSHNTMSGDHIISQCLYSTSSVSIQNCNNASISSSAYLSATALLQKAAQVGSSYSNTTGSTSFIRTLGSSTNLNRDDQLENASSLGTSSSVTCFSALQNSTNHIVHGGWMRCSNNGGGVGSMIPRSGELYTPNNGILVDQLPTGGGRGGLSHDVLTRDFLGVGLIVKPMSDGISTLNDDHMTSLQNDHHQCMPSNELK